MVPNIPALISNSFCIANTLCHIVISVFMIIIIYNPELSNHMSHLGIILHAYCIIEGLAIIGLGAIAHA